MNDEATTRAATRRRGDRAPTRIAVIGVHGYGASHVLRALELQKSGIAELVGLVDTHDGPVVREGVVVTAPLPPILPSIDHLLERHEVDIVVIATPLHTHTGLTERALLAGADVLLEKPPVTEQADLTRLLAVRSETGRLVQVGFQSLGSLALAELRALLAHDGLGKISAIGAVGSWTRDRRYWARAPWAGRRELDGVRVADGAVSNPFAHAVMTSLRIAGWDSAESIERVDADLYSVNPIEADDTSALRIHPSPLGGESFDGTITCAFTLAGPEESDPYIVVRGSKGEAVLYYTEDRLTTPDGRTRVFGRTDLMSNLIDARSGGTELLSPLETTGGFVSVIESIAAHPVFSVAGEHIEWHDDGLDAYPVLSGVHDAVAHAVQEQRLFRELPSIAWAR